MTVRKILERNKFAPRRGLDLTQRVGGFSRQRVKRFRDSVT